jgi:hypothetical protein
MRVSHLKSGKVICRMGRWKIISNVGEMIEELKKYRPEQELVFLEKGIGLSCSCIITDMGPLTRNEVGIISADELTHDGKYKKSSPFESCGEYCEKRKKPKKAP